MARRNPLQQLAQLDRIDPAVRIFVDRGGIQRYPFEYHPLVIGRQMTGDEVRAGANADNRGVRDVHVVAVGRIDLDPNIVTRVPARADPDGHRQPRRAREQVRRLEQLVSVAFRDLLRGFCFHLFDGIARYTRSNTLT